MLGGTEQIELDGLRIGYQRAGEGPPLVLLHGYVGDSTATWRPQIEGLSDEFTVVAWDAPGAVDHPTHWTKFGMAGYADCLRAFIEAASGPAPRRRAVVRGRARA